VAFAITEMLVGVSVLATPFRIRLRLDRLRGRGPRLVGLGRSADYRTVRVLLQVLLVPTALMGMTLPLLSASVIVRGTAFGPRLGAFMPPTRGAVAGAWLTGFILIGTIGIRRAYLLAAMTNIAVGALAWRLSCRVAEPGRSDEASAGEQWPRTGVGRIERRPRPRSARCRHTVGACIARARDRVVPNACAVPGSNDLRVHDDAGNRARGNRAGWRAGIARVVASARLAQLADVRASRNGHCRSSVPGFPRLELSGGLAHLGHRPGECSRDPPGRCADGPELSSGTPPRRRPFTERSRRSSSIV
jgi:hypothetical protein